MIVKPVYSAASEGVYLCRSEHEVMGANGLIMRKVNDLGLVNEHVLIMEYLDGDEYVGDCVVSKDGVHKWVAVWKYDKRCVNRDPFVYFAVESLTVNDGDEKVKALVEYDMGVLDTLGIKNGPSHAEVKW